jgi:ketosteroid isomerase-like protein
LDEKRTFHEILRTMSSENVEVVRRALETINRYSEAKAKGDQAAVDAAWERVPDLFAVDFEYREDPKWPGAQTYRGISEFRRVGEAYFEAFGRQLIEIENVLEASDLVVALIRWRAQGTASGVETEMEQGHVFALADRKITRWAIYFDRREALEAAGLSE